MLAFLTASLSAAEEEKNAFPYENVSAGAAEETDEAEEAAIVFLEDPGEEVQEAENATDVISIHAARNRAQEITKWIQTELREKIKDPV